MTVLWTLEDWRLARSLADGRRTAEEISDLMDGKFTPQQVHMKFERRRCTNLLRFEMGCPFQGAAAIPDRLAADRDARREASYRRTQTQEFFGDPPPGYSALDRKRQAEAKP